MSSLGVGRTVQRRMWVVAVGAVAAVALAITGLSLLPTPAPPTPPPVGGPYTLTRTNTVSLPFANCTIVTVNWSVVEGNATTFSVWTAGALPVTRCSEPAPVENLSGLCLGGNVSSCVWYAGTPWCGEFGMSGTCAFQSIGDTYGFSLYPYGSAPANEVVNFTLRVS